MAQRLDKWLVYARFARHRSVAVQLVEAGKIRVNRDRVTKCSHTVKPLDVLTIALGENVRIVRVVGEADKRGSAPLARQLYEDLSPAEKADATAPALC